ncbi:MAG: translation elongation factor Ts [Anaerolineales bacterium]|nr:translation elongation factor Ts [Anaerolineales bacterium]
MTITATLIKELRERTGVGPLDCKKALEQHNGDIDAAARYLREKGLAKADKKASRVANEGVIQSYQHFNGRIAVLVEVNCETDFVAKTEQFQAFARDIALHIANMAPTCVTREEVPADLLERERSIQRERVLQEGKPENVVDKIVDGRMDKFFEEIVLMEQSFIKDDSKTIEDLRKETVAAIGENVVIRRFVRYELGETDEGSAEADE